MRTNYQHTLYACYIGYITQAIINNFVPLLFLTFQRTFHIPLSQIGLLVTVNFGTQLIVDILSAKFVDRIGYRFSIMAAHIFAAAGLIGLCIFPYIFPSSYMGLSFSIILYAIGGGLTEVLISPIVEACPTEGKSAAMSLLHSFYCWGSVLVVAVSTILFHFLGINSWQLVSCLWALIPLFNTFYFSRVPINDLVTAEDAMGIRDLFRTRVFWIFAVLMLCSGASELAMSSWASAFAESALQLTKTAGDLAGPCCFALLMGFARLLHSKLANRINLSIYLTFCAVLCAGSYLLVSLSPNAVLSLVGCGLCGIAVGAMWPVTISMASQSCPSGGTALFALLALAGDIGCSTGPALVGFVSSLFNDNLKPGMLAAIIFPSTLFVVCLSRRRTNL